MTEVLGFPRRRVHDGFYKLDVVDTPHGKREYLVTTDSVTLLIYDLDRRGIYLVNQVREAMFRPDNMTAQITEAVAGRFDVALGPVGLAIKEAKEEVDIDLRPEQITILNGGRPMAKSPGSTTERAYLAYAEVRANQVGADRPSFGADGEGEDISRRFVTIEQLRHDYACEDLCVFALVQFLLHRYAQTARG